MKNITTNANALREQGIGGKTNTAPRKVITKIARVIEALQQPAGLNRFDAERIGDHALNSTVAIIRDEYGDRLIDAWETVPCRFTDRGVKVKRYWLLSAAPGETYPLEGF